MAKRRADKQLTRDDLDRLDEEDDDVVHESTSNEPVVATPEVLAQRKIAKARRSLPTGGENSGTRASIFSGISLTPSKSTVTPSSSTCLISNLGSTISSGPLLFGGLSSTTSMATMNGSSVLPKTNGLSQEGDRDPQFFAKLRKLNESFVNHLKTHIEKDPVADFTSNCSEYITFYKKLQNDYPEKLSQPLLSTPNNNFQSSSTPIMSETKKFGPSPAELAKSSAASESRPSTVTNKVTPLIGSTPPTQKIGLPSASSTPVSTTTHSTSTGGFNFASSIPPAAGFLDFRAQPPSTGGFGGFPQQPTLAAFGSQSSQLIQLSTSKTEETEGEESEEPPKLNQKELKTDEEGSLYSKRIKLYYRKEGKYEVLGKGVLHVKKLDLGKHQLIVRGENAIGTILLNVLLDPAIPLQQMKNNVQIIAVTKNPAKPNDDALVSVVYLMRCAAETEAADLVSRLNQFKGK